MPSRIVYLPNTQAGTCLGVVTVPWRTWPKAQKVPEAYLLSVTQNCFNICLQSMGPHVNSWSHFSRQNPGKYLIPFQQRGFTADIWFEPDTNSYENYLARLQRHRMLGR